MQSEVIITLRSITTVVLCIAFPLVTSGCLAQTTVAASGVLAGPVNAGFYAQTVQHTGVTQEASLQGFLQAYLKNPVLGNIRSTRYFANFVDLKGDGAREAIVYIMDDEHQWFQHHWCGSGGCTMLVLAPTGSSYEVIARVTITRPPIRVLVTRSHGWHDIGVWVQGGGIQPGYEARLSFNGKTYPSNPSVLPARRLAKHIPGDTVIPLTAFEQAKPLYP